MNQLKFKGGRQPSRVHQEVILRKRDQAEALKADLDRLDTPTEAHRLITLLESDAGAGREMKAVEMANDKLMRKLPSDRILEALAAHQTTEELEDEMLARYLAAARWATSDTGRITSRGDDDPERKIDGAYDRAPGEYSDTVSSDREEMMSDFLRSAAIVKRNRERKLAESKR